MIPEPPSRRPGARRRAPRRVGPGGRIGVLVATSAVGLAAGCGAGSDDAEVTVEDYRAELAAVCTETAAALDALPAPPEQITVTEFAVDAASLLASQAEQVRRLAVPDELADDHRAFVRNTDDQAASWRAVADTAGTGSASGSGDDDLVALTTRIGELQLGRDDLATEMGVPACRRAPDG
jgi:hypothetical protein